MGLFNDAVAEKVKKGATLSECEKYRYRLWRTWNPSLRPACFIALNPSTADAFQDDPTIRRCVTFASRWNCGGIEVVNLFALRATDPKELTTTNHDPVGPDNNLHIRSVAEQCFPVVAAWGVHGTMRGRDRVVKEILDHVGVRTMCLGTTKDGHPRHPLYVRGDVMAIPFGA